jgi:hypothetical protein
MPEAKPRVARGWQGDTRKQPKTTKPLWLLIWLYKRAETQSPQAAASPETES